MQKLLVSTWNGKSSFIVILGGEKIFVFEKKKMYSIYNFILYLGTVLLQSTHLAWK